MQKEIRKTVDDICLGDIFITDNGIQYDVVRFQGSMYVLCECDSEKFDNYFARDEDLRKRINDYFEIKLNN